jgi:hypothetical protein
MRVGIETLQKYVVWQPIPKSVEYSAYTLFLCILNCRFPNVLALNPANGHAVLYRVSASSYFLRCNSVACAYRTLRCCFQQSASENDLLKSLQQLAAAEWPSYADDIRYLGIEQEEKPSREEASCVYSPPVTPAMPPAVATSQQSYKRSQAEVAPVVEYQSGAMQSVGTGDACAGAKTAAVTFDKPRPNYQWRLQRVMEFVNLMQKDKQMNPVQEFSAILDKDGLPIRYFHKILYLDWHRLRRASSEGPTTGESGSSKGCTVSTMKDVRVRASGSTTAGTAAVDEINAATPRVVSNDDNALNDGVNGKLSASICGTPDYPAEEVAGEQRLLAFMNEVRAERGMAPLDHYPGAGKTKSAPRPPVRHSTTAKSSACAAASVQSGERAATADPIRHADRDAPDAASVLPQITATAGSPPDATVPAFVKLAWPDDAESENGPCAANVLELKCTAEQISAWVANALSGRYVALRAAWVEKVRGSDTSTASLEQAVSTFLGEAVKDHAVQRGLSVQRIALDELRERVCKTEDDPQSAMTPIEHLQGLTLMESMEENIAYQLLAHNSEADTDSVRDLRKDVHEVSARGDANYAASLGVLLAEMEVMALRSPFQPVALSVETAWEDHEPADAATRLAQRLLGTNRIAPRDGAHGGLLVEGWDRGRIMVLVQYPVLYVAKAVTTAIWVTLPARTAEQLADYMLLSVLCRGADLRDLLGKLDRVNGGGLLQEYDALKDAIDREISERAWQSNERMMGEDTDEDEEY